MNGERNGLTFAAGVLAAVLLLLGGLTGAIRLTAGDAALMEREMARYAPPEDTYLPAGEYAGMTRMIAGYLTGKTPVFQYRFSGADGSEYLCFHSYEAEHMADCRGLIRLDAIVCGCCFGGAALLFLTLIGAGRERRRRFAGGMLAGCCGTSLAAAALTVWGLADFDALFRTFHGLAFQNDLWLLDPKTDLLIRLMPVPFFIALALRALVCFLAWTAAVLVLSRLLRGRKTHEI